MDDKDAQLRGKLEGLFSDLSDSFQAEPGPGAPKADRPPIAQPVAALRTLAENSTDAILLSDLAGRVTFSNRACCDLLGYDYAQNEMVGLEITALWPDEEKARLTGETPFGAPLALTGEWRGEVMQRRKDGSLLKTSLICFPVRDEQERPFAMAILLHDLTERKHSQAERERPPATLARRAVQLPTSAEVSRAATSMLSLDESLPQTDMARPGQQPNARPTIGLLIVNIVAAWELQQWQGVADAAHERGVNLICFPGQGLRSPVGFEAQANALYQLVSANNVDGIILWTAGFGDYVSQEEIEAFCRCHHPLPIVSAERLVEGIPSVLLDNYQSMREAIRHLIEVHGYRRIAFVRGVSDPVVEHIERYRAYTDILAEYGLPFDPDLVCDREEGGQEKTPQEMADWLLDERRSGIEAMVGSNDSAALWALQAFQLIGQRPVALVGFDDDMRGRTITPPLTTVRPPFYEAGRKAVEMLLALLAGEAVPEQVTLHGQLIVRESCGCLSQAMLQATVEKRGRTLPAETLDATLSAQREHILSAMAETVGASVQGLASGWADRLLDSFAGELADVSGGEAPGAFVTALSQVLRQVADAGGDVGAWQGALSALRRHALPGLVGDSEVSARAENLWGLARVLIGETAQRAQAYRALQARQQSDVLREIGQTLITAFDMPKQMDILARELPRLDIPGCYVALYEDAQPYEYPQAAPEWSRLMLAYDVAGRIELEAGGLRFPSRQLAPRGMLPQDGQYSLVVEPLYFREDQLGFALFKAGPREGTIYDALRGQLCSALKATLLVQQVERRSLQLQTAAEVSRAVSSILDLDELIQQVVNLARERFNLYYVGLFLVQDPRQGMDRTGESPSAGEHGQSPGHPLPLKGTLPPGYPSGVGAGVWAVLRAGTGTAGQEMLKQGHKLEIGGRSMIGWCIANKQARIALDVGAEAVRFGNPLLPQTRSELALPLVSRGEAIGALTVQSAQEAAFTQDDVTAFQTMADLVANAIENARLLTERQRRITEQSILTELGQAIASSLEMEPLMETARQQVGRIFDTTNFFIASYTEGSDEWSQPFLVEFGQRCPPARYKMETGITSHVLRSRRPLVLRNRQEANNFYKDRGIARAVTPHGGSAQSWLGVPLIVADRVVGAMVVQSYEQENLYSEHDAALFSTIGAQVATAFENARLFERAQQATLQMRGRVQELDALNDIGRKIDETPPIPEFMQWAAERIPPVMQYPDVCQVVIEFDGRVYGAAEAVNRPRQIVQSLRRGSQVVGRICIAYTQEHDFLNEESALLGDIVRRVSGYIESRRLFEETRIRAERLAIVNRIASTAGATFHLDDLLETVYEGIVSAFEIDSVLIIRYDAKTDELDFLLAVEKGVRAAPQRSPVGGLSSVVVAEKKPLCIQDFEQERDHLPAPISVGVTTEFYASWLGVPMLIGEQVTGIISVMSSRPHAYGEEEQLLLQTIADQVAMALERTRLLEEARARAEELAVLNELGRSLTARLDVKQVLEEAYRQTSRLLDTTNFYIALYDAEKDEIHFALDVTASKIDKEITTISASRGFAGYIVRHRASVLIPENVQEQAEKLGIISVGEPSLSWLGVPLIVGDQVQGAMAVHSFTTPGLYGEHDRDLLTAIASQTSIALQNARLFEEVRARAERERAIREITDKMRRAANMDDLMQIAIREMAAAQGASSAFVQLIWV